ncbi:hypothetical protein EVJ58_g8345 [Rhodofomes roseus]|uniref:Dienelactone hydrolase domain-containing protein n=1 Tax=Rhodofomes roseus TaxID=34475 RepID=A0A4Y9Y121_9APHY|nr:hypothetical protein EVJ58_g8345 [Rhodofomes roseus]
MATIARSPGDCCIKTVEHSGTAQGTIEKFAGVDTYVSRPAELSEQRRVILFFADVYGPFFLNSQLIMDYWASNGYLVLALDYFEGDPVQNHLGKVGKNYSIEFDFVPGKMIRAKQITPDWIDAVKEQFGTSQTQWLTVEIDHTFPLEFRRRAEDIMVEIKATYHIQVFSGVTHGFSLRGNVDDPVAKWAKEQSASTILSWFDNSCAAEQRPEVKL